MSLRERLRPGAYRVFDLVSVSFEFRFRVLSLLCLFFVTISVNVIAFLSHVTSLRALSAREA